MKNLIKCGRAVAYITPDGGDYMVVAEFDVTEEEVRDAIVAEEELQRYRKCAVWN